MPSRRILLLGEGDLTDETCAALEASGADVVRLEDPGADELREALEQRADAVAVVSRDDAWPLRAALLVRHIDADVPIVATIFDPMTGRELEQEIGNIKITSLADIVAPTLAGPCLDEGLAAVVDGDGDDAITGLRCSERRVRADLAAGGPRAPRAGARDRDPAAVRPQRGARVLRRGRAPGDPRRGDHRRRDRARPVAPWTPSTAPSRRS